MSDKFFLDSNTCLYCFDSHEKKQSIALNLLAARPIISTQVLHETAAVCLRKWRILPQDVTAIIKQLIAWCDVAVLPATMSLRALDLITKYAFSWWDALIVAAARDAPCTILYSEDLQDGLQVEGSLVEKSFPVSVPGEAPYPCRLWRGFMDRAQDSPRTWGFRERQT